MRSVDNAVATALFYPPHPTSHGYVKMREVFIDTIIIYTATVSIILLLDGLESFSGVSGIEMT